MPERSMPWPKPESALVSNENACCSLSSSTVKMESMSSSFCSSFCSSSKVLPVKTSTSGLACCSATICASAAISIRRLVSNGEYAMPSESELVEASSARCTMPTTFSVMPSSTAFFMKALSPVMSVQVPCSAFFWYRLTAGTTLKVRLSASSSVNSLSISGTSTSSPLSAWVSMSSIALVLWTPRLYRV